ncbi:hypothetical protein [Oryzibacter oryziterrae]|uniref:hypothetical protein n=1 Tax=Oryzibacter oryziterrae TaxID=2766474 RepID=UPI001F2405A5|nr:hypothetical protein [Oryzibacter oryziterrae]
MHVRRPVKALTGDDVRAMDHLWHHAAKIGAPLTAFVTVNIFDFDALSPQDKADANRRILDNLGQFARREGFPIVYIWAREIGVDNTGEHLHILAHVPRHLFRKFKRLANAWLPGNEIQIAAASYRISKAEDGKLHSALHYMAKQMDHRANFRAAWRRVKGGTIFGARWGCSQSLRGEKAEVLKAREMRRRAFRRRQE